LQIRIIRTLIAKYEQYSRSNRIKLTPFRRRRLKHPRRDPLLKNEDPAEVDPVLVAVAKDIQSSRRLHLRPIICWRASRLLIWLGIGRASILIR